MERRSARIRHRQAERRRALRRQRAATLLVVASALTLLVVLLFTLGPLGSSLERPGEDPLGYLRDPLGGRDRRVAAWTLGDLASLRAAIAAHAVDEVDFDWYCSQRDGGVKAFGERLAQVALAAEHDLNVFATVTNRKDGASAFDRKIAVAILRSQATRRRHIENLVALVREKGYDGIDLDWEELQAQDRERFGLFVEELAEALHEEGRFLSIALYPKTSEPGRWGSQRAEDYARIGAAADEVKIMTYAYSGSWSDPGPQAPFAWVDQVLTFAEGQMPAEKIAMGMPFFGFEWGGGGARALTARNAAAVAQRVRDVGGTSVSRHQPSAEVVLTYVDQSGARRVAYYPDAKTVSARLQRLRDGHPQVGGIAVWVMGQEVAGFWSAVARRLR